MRAIIHACLATLHDDVRAYGTCSSCFNLGVMAMQRPKLGHANYLVGDLPHCALESMNEMACSCCCVSGHVLPLLSAADDADAEDGCACACAPRGTARSTSTLTAAATDSMLLTGSED